MVNAATTNRYVQYANKKQNTPATEKESASKSKPPESSSDLLYILDLSGINNRNESSSYQNDKSAAFLDLTKEAQEKLGNKSLREAERAEATEEEGEGERPSDETRALTRRLVAAKTQDDVQSVLMDTYGHLREWQKLASNGDKEAIKVVRKLSRLISRGNRKIRDLLKELVMHQRKERAENAEKNQEARRLENELKEAQRERMARERRYLQERDDDNEDEESSEFGPTMAETEAKIRQLAGEMAALKTNAVDAGYDGSSGGMTDIGGGGIESAEISGEVSGEVSGEESSGE